MNSLFLNKEQFLNETASISKHLSNTKLTILRLAIAKRHGFKSVKMFCDHLDGLLPNKSNDKNVSGLKVFVVAFETLSSSGGFYWFYKESDALEYFEKEKKNAMSLVLNDGLLSQASFFEYVTNETENEKITAELDLVFSDLMLTSENCYPYSLDAWKIMVNSEH